MRFITLALALGCTDPDKARSPASATETGDSAHPDSDVILESGLPGESAEESGESGGLDSEDSAQESGGGETGDSAEPEEPDPLDGLCQLTMDCTDVVDSESEKVPCTLTVADQDGVVWYEGAAVAWIRGRSTSYVPKKQYGVELRDERDESVEADLLGMGLESDWVINGNYYDRLLVRNKLGFDMFQSWGDEERYAPQSALCELTLDGEYRGAYSLVERIKRDGSRIDIERDDGEGGSFVMKQNDEGCFYTNTTTYGCWKLIYPNEDDISEGSAEGITAWLSGWEAAVVSADPYDDATGVFTYVDIDSLVDIILIEEFFKNEDAFYTSMHLWKDQGGLIHFTPWDLDMTFGQFPYYPYGDYDNPEVWIDYRPQLMTVMSSSPEFQERIAARWEELRAGPMQKEAIFADIDRLQAIYGEAIDRNFELWPIESINYGGYFYEVSSYEDEDAYVRDWIERRLAWMDENIGSYAL